MANQPNTPYNQQNQNQKVNPAQVAKGDRPAAEDDDKFEPSQPSTKMEAGRGDKPSIEAARGDKSSVENKGQQQERGRDANRSTVDSNSPDKQSPRRNS